jgi:hypothetical protein
MMRRDAKVQKSISTSIQPPSESPSTASLPWSSWTSRSPSSTRCFFLPQQTAQPFQDLVMGAQRLLPRAQVPRVRAF